MITQSVKLIQNYPQIFLIFIEATVKVANLIHLEKLIKMNKRSRKLCKLRRQNYHGYNKKKDSKR
jgi:hypothetical protein